MKESGKLDSSLAPIAEIDVLKYVVENGGAAALSEEQLKEIKYVRPDQDIRGYIVPAILLKKKHKLVIPSLDETANLGANIVNQGWHGPRGVGSGRIPGHRAAAHFSGQIDDS